MDFWEQLDKPSILMAAGVALLAAVLLRRTYRRLATANPAHRSFVTSSATEPHSRLARSNSLDAIEVHLHETARELAAQLDSKAVLLEQWIRLAHDEAERLERAIEAARQLGLSGAEATSLADDSHEHAP